MVVRKTSLFVCLFLLIGCEPRHYIDISRDKEYRNNIGLIYQTKIELKVHGISLGIDGDWAVDYVYLTPPPGIGGNYVKFYGELDKNTKIKVVGVKKSAYSKMFGHFYSVKLIDNEEYKNYEIIVDITDDIDSDNKGLNNKVFKLVK